MRLLILTLAAIIACVSSASIHDSSLDASWTQFKSVFGKSYVEKDEVVRRGIWEKNLKFINAHNLQFGLGKKTFSVKMNKFGDMTNQEFVRQMNGFNMTKSMKKLEGSHYVAPSNVQVPDSVDWRTQGYVTPMKDQGQCGSCWAFSAIASLEGQHFKSAGKLVSLSEQNLVDCSSNFGNMGCDGGLMDQSFAYIKANKGIDTEASYPYTAEDGTCVFDAANVGATDSGFTDITSGDEDALVSAIATVGPISVAIDASQDSFQFYSSGIYNEPDCSSDQLDHGVTAVGYGSQGSGKDFYIVKNSWGTSWGDQGYILMSRNKDNQCGIATMSSYPLV
jgi:cathepsin L